MKIILSFFLLIFPWGRADGADIIEVLIRQAYQENPEIRAALSRTESASFAAEAAGYLPDPIVSFNYFGSPVETRNGPQRSNIMLSQKIPWPSTLDSFEQKAMSSAEMKSEQLKLLRLKIRFSVQSLVYKHILLKKQKNNKNKLLISLEKLTKVALGRLKVGESTQADISRINIETAKLSQEIRSIESQLNAVKSDLENIIGNSSIDSSRLAVILPEQFKATWLTIPKTFTAEQTDLADHPLLRLHKKKIDMASADITLEKNKRLPVIGASATWIRIDEPTGIIPPDGGKDAWAIGISISIPVWSSKYDSMEKSAVSEKSVSQFSLDSSRRELRTSLAKLSDEYEATRDIVSVFSGDILPQAKQTLASDQKSYEQGSVLFDRVIDDYIRIIKFEDQLETGLARQATLKAGIERVSGRSLNEEISE